MITAADQYGSQARGQTAGGSPGFGGLVNQANAAQIYQAN